MATDDPRSPLQMREALVIVLAIVVVGGAWVYVEHRDRMTALELITESADRRPLEQEFAREASDAILDESKLAKQSDAMLTALALRLRADGRLAEAIRASEEIVRRHPDDHAARLALAEDLQRTGETARARAHAALLLTLGAGGDERAAACAEGANAILR